MSHLFYDTLLSGSLQKSQGSGKNLETYYRHWDYENSLTFHSHYQCRESELRFLCLMNHLFCGTLRSGSLRKQKWPYKNLDTYSDQWLLQKQPQRA